MTERRNHKEKRRSKRHALHVPVSYTVLAMVDIDSVHQGSSRTVNISEDGLLLSTRREIRPNTSIEISLPFHHQLFTLTAKVIYCSPVPDSKYYSIGVCFDEGNDILKARLMDQLSNIIAYRETIAKEQGEDISLQEAAKRWFEEHGNDRLTW